MKFSSKYWERGREGGETWKHDGEALIPLDDRWQRLAEVPNIRQLMSVRLVGYKTFFMLNSTEHEIFPAHKC